MAFWNKTLSDQLSTPSHVSIKYGIQNGTIRRSMKSFNRCLLIKILASVQNKFIVYLRITWDLSATTTYSMLQYLDSMTSDWCMVSFFLCYTFCNVCKDIYASSLEFEYCSHCLSSLFIWGLVHPLECRYGTCCCNNIKNEIKIIIFLSRRQFGMLIFSTTHWNNAWAKSIFERPVRIIQIKSTSINLTG